jgi:hypothetical protein
VRLSLCVGAGETLDDSGFDVKYCFQSVLDVHNFEVTDNSIHLDVRR